jgi:hypothetical protein
LPNIIWIFKSTSKRWAGQEVHRRKKGNIDRVLCSHLKDRDLFGRWDDNTKLDVQCADRVWTGLVWLTEGTEAGSYKHCNKSPG